MNDRLQIVLRTAAGAWLALCATLSPAAAANFTIGYQGQLRQNGVPVTGSKTIVFKVYAASADSVPVWTGPSHTVQFTNGQFFSTFTPVNVDWENTTPVLEISIDGTALSPRELLSSTPYAFNAQLHSGKKYTSSASAPSGGAAGDLWYDSSGSVLRYFNGTTWVTPGTGGVSSSGSQFTGDGSSGAPLTLQASSVTLQGNIFNVADRLVKLDSSGDLRVGSATPATLHASGFLTLANLGSAPAGAAGRLYYDSTLGKLRLHNGTSFVDIATGTAGVAGGAGASLSADQTFLGANAFAKDVALSTAGLATVGVQGVNSPILSFRGQAWDTGGLFSANRQMFVTNKVTNDSSWRLAIDRGAADLWSLDQAGRVLMSGDLLIGGNPASTFSASGFLTLAGLASAPAGAAGRLYFDSPTGKLRLHTGAAFVDIATGTVGAGGGGAVSSQAGQFTGDGSSGSPLALVTSSVTLQGNTFNAPGRLLQLDSSGRYPALNGSLITNLPADAGKVSKAGDTMTGDLQVGAATASTLSASGFMTLANLGSAPGAERGRVYFDPNALAGRGALKISLDGTSFVSLATGSAAGGISAVSANAAQFSGDGSGTPLALVSSSVTLQGNLFNAANSLLKLDASGLVPSANLGNINAAQLADGSIESTKLASSSVTSAKLAAGAVETAKLAADSVTGVKILDGAVTVSKLAAGAVETAKLAADSVTGAKLLDGAVTASKLAAGAVETAKLAADSVTGAKILDGTITRAKLNQSGCNSGEVLKWNGSSWACSTDNTAGGAVNLGPASADADATANPSIFINDTAGGNLLTLQQAGVNKFTVDNTGLITSASVGAGSLQAGAVDSTKLAAGAVGAAQLLDGGVTSLKIAAGGVDSTRLAAGAVGSSQLADGAVTAAKLGAGAVDSTKLAAGAVVAAGLADGAVTASKLGAGAVDSTKLAASGVATANLADGAVTSSKLAAGAIDSTRLAAGAVDSTRLADGAVSAAKLAAGAVDSTKLLDGAVTGAKLGLGAVDSTKLAAGAVVAAGLADGAVTAAKLGAGAVDSTKLASGAVGSTQLLDGAVTGAKLAAGSVDSTKLAGGALGSASLADGAVTTAKLASGAVDSTRLASGAVVAAGIADGAVSSAKIAASAVDSTKLAAGAVTDDKVAAGISQSKITNLTTDLAAKLGASGGTLNAALTFTNVAGAALAASGTTPGLNLSSHVFVGGSLGIGTTSPTAKLHVTGTPGVDGIRFPDGTLMTTAGVGSATNLSSNVDALINADADSNGSGSVRMQTAGADRMTILSGGNVGIGTGAPGTNLDVAGSIRLSSDLEVNAGGPRLRSPEANTLAFHTAGGLGSAANERMRIDSNGNVGIGAAGPASRLHLSSGTVLIDGNVATALIAGGNVGIGTSPSAPLHIDRASEELFRLGRNGVRTHNLRINPSGTLVFGDDSPAGDLAAGTNLSIGDTGNVGIGTTSPGQKLTVAGTIESTSGGIKFPDGSVQTVASVNPWTTSGSNVNNGNAGNVGVGQASPTARLHVSSAGALSSDSVLAVSTAAAGGEVLVVKGSGRVGVGFGSPVHPLHVTSNQAGRTTLMVDNRTSGANTSAALSFAKDGSERWSLFSDVAQNGTNDLTFFDASAGQHRLSITNAGNVGLGTTSPQSKLDVSGSAAVGGAYAGVSAAPANGLIVQGNVGVGTASPQAAFNVVGISSISANSASAALLVSQSGSGPSAALLGGNVGVGTASPGERLDVNGAMVMRGMTAPAVASGGQAKLYFDSGANKLKLSENGGAYTNLIGAAGGAVSLQGSSPGTQDGGNINVSGAGLFGGRVGAGTTSPVSQSKLTVGGSISLPLGASDTDFASGGNRGMIDVEGTAPNLKMRIGTVQGGAGATGGMDFYSNGSVAMSLDGSGKLGIGAASPGESLDVNGAMVLRGVAAPALASAGQGKMYFDSTANKVKFSENGAAFVNLIGGAGGAITLQGSTPGIADSGHLNLTGSGIFGGNLGIGTVSPTQKLDLRSGGLAVSFDGSAGSSLFVNSANGRTGIGTTSPQSRLDVSGSAVIGAGYAGTSAGPANGLLVQGSMGVGATSPATTLEVNGTFSAGSGVAKATITASGDFNLPGAIVPELDGVKSIGSASRRWNAVWANQVNLSGGMDAGGNAISRAGNVVPDTDNAANLGSSTKHWGNIFTSTLNATGSLYIENRVGIGTAAPGQKLSVVGTIESTSGGFRFPDGSVQTVAAGASQWAGSGLNIYNTNAANVGAGTTSPTARLHVASAAATASDTVLLVTTTTAAGSEVLAVRGDGKVGIGIAAPASALHVAGLAAGRTFVTIDNRNSAANSSAVLRLAKEGADRWFLMSDVSQNGNNDLSFYDALGASHRFYIKQTGEIGIGTTSPAAGTGLTVAANAANPAFSVTQSGAGPSASFMGGKVGIGTTSPAQQLSVTGTIESTAGGFKFPDGSVQTTAAGGATLWGSVGTDSQNLNAGSVGIGTASPLSRLHVSTSGFAEMRVALITNEQAAAVNNSARLGLGLKGFGGNLAEFAAIAASATNVTSNAGDLVFHTANGGALGERARLLSSGNLGVGVADPGEKLDVGGAMVLRGMSAPAVASTGQTKLYFDSASNKLKVSENGTAFTNLIGGAGGAVTLQASTPGLADSGHINVTGSGIFGGNVGIGVSGPAQKLDIRSGGLAVSSHTTAGATLFASPTNGRVGVGTSSPAELLHVSGPDTVRARVEGASEAALHLTGPTTWELASRGDNRFGLFQIGGSERLTVNASGNVGIGTTGPLSKFHVLDGDIRLSTTSGNRGIYFPDGSYLTSATAGFSSWSETGGVFHPSTLTKKVAVGRSDLPSAMLSVSTNSTATPALYVEAASGNIAAGSSAPGERLDVNGAMVLRGMSSAPALASGGQGKMYFDSGANKLKISEDGGAFVNLIGGAGGAVTLQGSTPGLPDTGHLNVTGTGTFGVLAINTNSPSQKLDIRSGGLAVSHNSTAGQALFADPSNGRVGIGTTSPSAKLQVTGGDLYVGNPTVHDTTANADLLVEGNLVLDGILVQHGGILSSFEKLGVGAQASGSELFRVGAGSMTVLSTGKTGLGTTSPSALLHLKAPTADGAQLWIDRDSASAQKSTLQFRKQGAAKFTVGTDYSDSGANDFFLYDEVAATARLYVNAAGQMGIGTTSPAPGTKLDVVGAGTFSVRNAVKFEIDTSNASYASFLVDGTEVIRLKP